MFFISYVLFKSTSKDKKFIDELNGVEKTIVLKKKVEIIYRPYVQMWISRGSKIISTSNLIVSKIKNNSRALIKKFDVWKSKKIEVVTKNKSYVLYCSYIREIKYYVSSLYGSGL